MGILALELPTKPNLKLIICEGTPRLDYRQRKRRCQRAKPNFYNLLHVHAEPSDDDLLLLK